LIYYQEDHAMTTTVKLPPELEQSLRQHCAVEGRSISEVMRDALVAYLASVPAAPASAWLLGADLFGRHAGPADLATARRQHLAEAWGDKQGRRNAH
jgi:predicted transcriptional regulator